MKVLVIITLIVISTITSIAGQLNSTEIYKKTVSSIVYIQNQAIEKRKDGLVSAGTGFIVEGHLITCDHLIHTNTLAIQTYDGKKFRGEVVKRNKSLDIAEIKIAVKLPSLVLAEKVSYLDETLMIGHTNTLRFIGTTGRFISSGSWWKYSLFNLISPRGNSGSPILNKKGEVVGMCVSGIGTTTWGGKINTIQSFINKT